MPDTYVDHLHWSAVVELTARVALSIIFEFTRAYIRVLDAALEALPLDKLVTLTAQRHTRFDKPVWLHHASQCQWPLLEQDWPENF